VDRPHWRALSQGSIGFVLSISVLTGSYLHSTGAYGKDNAMTSESLPENPAAERLADGLAEAHAKYGNGNAAVLFVVQDLETNIFDQRCLEYRLLEEHSIQTVRMTLYEIGASAELGTNYSLVVPTIVGKAEISVVYLRAGYGPGDYPTETVVV
jgi:glutathione synthase